MIRNWTKNIQTLMYRPTNILVYKNEYINEKNHRKMPKKYNF